MSSPRASMLAGLLVLGLVAGCGGAKPADLSTLAPLSEKERSTPSALPTPSGSATRVTATSSPSPSTVVQEAGPEQPVPVLSPDPAVTPTAPTVTVSPEPLPSPAVSATPRRTPTLRPTTTPRPTPTPTPIRTPVPPTTPTPRPPRPPSTTTAEVASALAGASSVTVTVVEGAMRATVSYDAGRARGHVDVGGRVLDFVTISSTLYVRATSSDWSAYGGYGVAQARSMGGKWYRATVSRFAAAPYAYLFTQSRLAGALRDSAGSARTATRTSYGGRVAIALAVSDGRTLYASGSGSPRPLRLDAAFRSFAFSYSAARITAPAPVYKLP